MNENRSVVVVFFFFSFFKILKPFSLSLSLFPQSEQVVFREVLEGSMGQRRMRFRMAKIPRLPLCNASFFPQSDYNFLKKY